MATDHNVLLLVDRAGRENGFIVLKYIVHVSAPFKGIGTYGITITTISGDSYETFSKEETIMKQLYQELNRLPYK